MRWCVVWASPRTPHATRSAPDGGLLLLGPCSHCVPRLACLLCSID